MRILLAVLLVLGWAGGAFAQSVTGNAEITFADGTRIDCGGRRIFAVPKQKKSSEQLRAIYGPTFPAFAPILYTPGVLRLSQKGKTISKLQKVTPSSVFGVHLKGTKTTKCYQGGDFAFKKLKPGEWFIVAPVYKNIAGSSHSDSVQYQGGGSNTSVSVKNNYIGGTLAVEVLLVAGETIDLPLVINEGPDADEAAG